MNPKKIITYFLLFLCYTSAFSQKNLNAYKYIIIPDMYSFQKSENQYQINDLIAFLFKKKRFLVIREKENLPKDLKKDRCLALVAKISENSNFFTTKTTIHLIDCFNKSLFSSIEGKSREKDHKKAYQQAIRNAFTSVPKHKYLYPLTSKTDIITTSTSIKTPPKSNTTPTLKPNLQNKNLLGTYLFPKWGKCSISKKKNHFSLTTGDENFEIASIYKTSKSNLFIIKWKSEKMPFLLEKLTSGNITIDSKTSFVIIKKI